MAWARWFLAALAVISLAGCNSSGKKQNTGDVRFLHASVDSEALDILVEDDVKAAALALGGTSGYANFSSGTQDTKVRSATNGTVLVDKSIAYASASGQTLVVFGKRNNLQLSLLADDTTNPDSGKFRVRAFGLSPDAGAIDVYLSATPAIDAQPANLAAVGYGATTDFTQVNEGNLSLVFAAAGTKEVLFQAPARSFTAGNRYTVLVFPSAGGKLVNALLLQGGGDGTYIANTRARIRAVNADPASTGYNFLADGAGLLSNVPYKGVSTYVLTSSGSRSLTLESANVPGTAAASATATLNPALDYTEIAWTSSGIPQVAVIPDDNTLPSSTKAKIRFVNAFASGSTVDAALNFASIAGGIAPRAASAYYEVTPSDTYTVTFTTPGGVTVITTLDPAKIEAGGIYSVYGFGGGSAAEAKLVRDR